MERWNTNRALEEVRDMGADGFEAIEVTLGGLWPRRARILHLFDDVEGPAQADLEAVRSYIQGVTGQPWRVEATGRGVTAWLSVAGVVEPAEVRGLLVDIEGTGKNNLASRELFRADRKAHRAAVGMAQRQCAPRPHRSRLVHTPTPLESWTHHDQGAPPWLGDADRVAVFGAWELWCEHDEDERRVPTQQVDYAWCLYYVEAAWCMVYWTCGGPDSQDLREDERWAPAGWYTRRLTPQ